MTDLERELSEHHVAHVESLCATHERALARAGADWVAIPSGSLRETFLDDRTYDFVPNPHFKSWLPLTSHPDCCVVFRRGGRPKLIYVQPRDFWHMPPEAPGGFWADQFEISIVDSANRVGAELGGDPSKGIVIGELNGATDFFGVDRVNPAAALNVLHNARRIKTAYELSCMRETQRLAVAAHNAAKTAFYSDKSEYNIHMAYCSAMNQRESELPYNNIVALNEHAAVLHYQHLDRSAPATVRSFLIDAGAQFHGYAADITRTYSRSDDTFKALVVAMDELQTTIVGEVRAGVDYRALHLMTHRLIAKLLIEHDIASSSPDELIAADITKAFFPHGLGHFLGLQVHDVAGLSTGDDAKPAARPAGHEALRLTRELEADEVLTIEPGLYFIPMLLDALRNSGHGKLIQWNTVDRMIPFGGIRIEDNVRVLADNNENMTRDAFRAG